jgi:predicted acyltransferase (DUF342 family)
MNSAGTDNLGTLGSNSTPFEYLTQSADTQYYPAADVTVSLGPMQTPQIYAKDVNVLEIGSSGQVVMSLQDQASITFSNDTANTITYMKGANNNAIDIKPTDSNQTVVIGHMTTDSRDDWQELMTTETNGIRWMSPVKLQSTLTVAEVAVLNRTLDVCGATVLWSTLSVHDRATFAGPVTTSGSASMESSMSIGSILTVQNGSVHMGSQLQVSSNTYLQKTIDICGSTVLHSTLSVAGSMRTTDMIATEVNVESITSSGSISFGNDVIMLAGMNVIGDVRLSSSLRVDDAVTFRSTMDVCGGTVLMRNTLSVKDTTYVSNQLTVEDGVSMNHTLSIAGSLSTGGSVAMSSTLDVSGAITLRNDLSVYHTLHVAPSGTVELGSSLSVSNAVYVGGIMDIIGPAGESYLTTRDDMRIAGHLSVTQNTTMDSSMQTFGDAYILKQQSIEFMNTKYIWFNNNGGYMVASREYNLENQWSMTLWVRVISAVTNQAIVADTRVSGVSAFLFLLDDRSVDDMWHFYTVTMDGTYVRYYKDGSTIPFTTNGPRGPTGEDYASFSFYKPTFGMGYVYNGVYVSNIAYDEIAIYQTVLTVPQITAVFNNGVPQDVRTLSGISPVSYYRFESLSASNTVPDLIVSNPVRFLQAYVAGSPTNAVLSSYDPYAPSGVGTNSLYTDGSIASHMYLSKNLSMGGSIAIDGSMTVEDRLNGSSNLAVLGTTTLTNQGSLQVRSTLDVYGALTLRSTLSVSNGVSFDSTLKGISGNFESTLDIAQNVTISQGALRLGSTLSVASHTDLLNTLDVSGATRLWSTLSVHSTTTFANNLVVSGPTELSSSLTVISQVDLADQVILTGSLSVYGSVSMQSSLDVCGSTVYKNTLSVHGDVDVCGNVHISPTGTGTATVTFDQTASIVGPTVMKSTLTVSDSATFSSEIVGNLYRPSSGTGAFTIDASKTIIRGNVDILGTINTTTNNVDTMMVQDKSLTLSKDPSGGQHVNGTFTNHNAGVYIDGLPAGVADDPDHLFEKSFSWKYDSINGAEWSSLGSSSGDNTVLPHEPMWQMRGGSFKMANYRNESNGSMFTMRINAQQEFEVWRSLLVNNDWVHTRVTRFGVTKTVDPISFITSFTAPLGDTMIGTTSLSIQITSVTDSLYITRGVMPLYMASNISLKSGATSYPVQNGFSFGLFTGSDIGTVIMTPQVITGLPVDTMFDAIQMTLANQYGVTATLTSILAPTRATLDLNGPQIVNSVSVTPNEITLDIVMSTYDIGVSTTNYTGVVFASPNGSLDVATMTITSVTPNTYVYTGTGKTALTADTRTFTLNTDFSGNAMVAGTYYVYYVLYDPNTNKTTNKLGPYTLVQTSTTVVDPSGYTTARLAVQMATNYYSGYTNPTNAVMLTSSDRVLYMVDYATTSPNRRVDMRVYNSPYNTLLYSALSVSYSNTQKVPAQVGMAMPNGDYVYLGMDNGGNTDIFIRVFKYENYSSVLNYYQGIAYQDSSLFVLRSLTAGYTATGDIVFYAYHGRNDGWQYISALFRVSADRNSLTKLADLGSTGSGQNNGFLTNPKLAVVNDSHRMGSSAIVAPDYSNGGFIYVYVNNSNNPQVQRYSYNGTSYVKGTSAQLLPVAIDNPTTLSDDLVSFGGAHVFNDGNILFVYKTKRVLINSTNGPASMQGATNGDTGMTNTYFGYYKGYAVVRMGELGTPIQRVRAVNSTLQEVADFGLMPTLKYVNYNSFTNKLIFVDASGFVIKTLPDLYDVYANNKSLSLNGTNQYATLTESLNYSGAWSLSMWIKINTVTTTHYGHIWDGRVNSNNINPYNFEYYLNNNSAFIGSFNIHSVTTLRDLNWHHVVFTTDGSTFARYYEDNILKASATTITNEMRMTRVMIGHWTNTDLNYINAMIDETALFNTGLLPEGVTALYNNGVPINLKANSGGYVSKDNLQAWWRFEYNSGKDFSGYNRDLTLFNTPTHSNLVPGKAYPIYTSSYLESSQVRFVSTYPTNSYLVIGQPADPTIYPTTLATASTMIDATTDSFIPNGTHAIGYMGSIPTNNFYVRFKLNLGSTFDHTFMRFGENGLSGSAGKRVMFGASTTSVSISDPYSSTNAFDTSSAFTRDTFNDIIFQFDFNKLGDGSVWSKNNFRVRVYTKQNGVWSQLLGIDSTTQLPAQIYNPLQGSRFVMFHRGTGSDLSVVPSGSAIKIKDISIASGILPWSTIQNMV